MPLDMFPGAAALGDSVQALFGQGTNSEQSAYYAESRQIQTENRLYSAQDRGVQNSAYANNREDATRNNPQYGNEKNRPPVTEDPQVVEDRWTARMAKFAGIAQSTGVKMGGL